jgi:DNA-binding MarR family transcriptional regulator
MSTARLDNLVAVLATGLADEQRRAAVAATGLSESATAGLVALDQFLDGSRIGALAGVLGLSHSGAVRLVAQLGEAGLVRRDPLGDGREVGVRLTDAGRRTAGAAARARAEAAAALTADLSPRQAADLERVLDRLVTGLTRQRLERRGQGAEEAWLCRTCDLTACGRPESRCPAARTAAAPDGRT